MFYNKQKLYNLMISIVIICLFLYGCTFKEVPDEIKDEEVTYINDTSTDSLIQDSADVTEDIKDLTPAATEEEFKDHWEDPFHDSEDHVYCGEIHAGDKLLKYSAVRKDGTLDMDIVIKDSSSIVQEISYVWCKKLWPPERVLHGIKIIDVNGDRYEDILIDIGMYGGYGVQNWSCYIYDMQSEMFIPVEGFEELEDIRITTARGSIRTSWKSGVMIQGTEKYILEADQLILVGRLVLSNVVNGSSMYTEEYYENGELILIKENLSFSEINLDFWDHDLLPIAGVNIEW